MEQRVLVVGRGGVSGIDFEYDLGCQAVAALEGLFREGYEGRVVIVSQLHRDGIDWAGVDRGRVLVHESTSLDVDQWETLRSWCVHHTVPGGIILDPRAPRPPESTVEDVAGPGRHEEAPAPET